jgi:hypothetical protein
MSSPTTFTYSSKWNHPIGTALTLDVHVQVYADLSKETSLAFCLIGDNYGRLTQQIPIPIDV